MWVRTLKRENLRVMGTRDVSDVLLVCALIHPCVQLGVYACIHFVLVLYKIVFACLHSYTIPAVSVLKGAVCVWI